MKTFKILSLAFICVVLAGCAGNESVCNVDDDDVASESEYMTGEFVYPSRDLSEYIPVNTLVKMYVDGNVLYITEKFHCLTLCYSKDDDSTLMYQNMIFFDKTQEPDSNGFYRLPIEKKNINRVPNTHLSGIVLRSYIGNKQSHEHGEPQANLYVYNTTKEIDPQLGLKELPSQFQKLLPIIK